MTVLLLCCIDAHVCIGLIVHVCSCAQCYKPSPGSMAVLSLWNCYFGVGRLRSLGTPELKEHIIILTCRSPLITHYVYIVFLLANLNEKQKLPKVCFLPHKNTFSIIHFTNIFLWSQTCRLI